jgi:type VI secretion system protein ImpH
MNEAASLERVLSRAHRLPFARLVFLIEHLLKGKARVGGRGPFYDEPVRFRHDASLVFHTQDVASVKLVRPHEQQAHVEVETTFSGLTGATSPLPLLLTEELASPDDDGFLQRELLDIFHHRFLGLFYRGLMKFDYPRSFVEGAKDETSRRVLALGGFAELADDADERGLPSGFLLRFAPLLASYPANAERLEIAVRDALGHVLAGAPVRVTPLTGRSILLEEGERPRLGRNFRLGRDSVLGRRIPAPASRVRLGIGPLSPVACARIAPRGDQFGVLADVIRLMVPPSIDVEVELQPSIARGARLGRSGGARLGLNAWLGSDRRAAALRYRPCAVAR